MKILQKLVFRFLIKPKLAQLKALLPDVEIFPTGSMYVCNPPVISTDLDFIVYNSEDLSKRLTSLGFTAHTLEYPFESKWDFSTWRKDKLNLIFSSSKEFTNRFMVATHVCKEKNIRIKYHRVVVHEIIRDSVKVDTFPSDFDKELEIYLRKFSGQYEDVMWKAYMINHNLTGVR
jgi:hypothetical protein